VVIQIWPLTTDIHRLSLHVLVMEVHDDVVGPQLWLIRTVETSNCAEIVELHQRQQRFVELLPLIMGGEHGIINIGSGKVVEGVDVKPSDTLVTVDGK
jgi:hypothetical protein